MKTIALTLQDRTPVKKRPSQDMTTLFFLQNTTYVTQEQL